MCERALSPIDGKLIVTEGDEAYGGSSLHSASPDGEILSPLITGYIPADGCALNPDGSGIPKAEKNYFLIKVVLRYTDL
ncbi:hypothetical protein [Pelotomaculum propionicicum]|uniref:hypothetical protein n=1 Tax=Pelotomaculum propionicicum TaxID=258475 RepID=UPI001291BBFA|nr:hypothetical protein [Pelotomaculum propionicicum]NMB65094.1 hypothetical protein [Spirochaetota bacterium]